MEFSIAAGLFRDLLTAARSATPAHPSLVAYSGVQIQVKGGRLSLTGSDGETTITASEALTEHSKEGKVLVPPRPLGNFLNTVKADTLLKVKLNASEALEVKPEGSNPYAFNRIVATFSSLPALKNEPRHANFSRLDQALSSIRSSVSKQDQAVQVVSNDEGLFLRTTDFYRITQAHLPEAGFGSFTGLLPLPVLERLSKFDVNLVTVDPKGRTIRFEGASVSLNTRLLSVAFPEVDNFLTLEPLNKVTIPAEKLRTSLARLNSVAELAPLKVRLEHEQIVLSVTNADLGAGSETFDMLDSVSAPFEFHVKLPFMMDLCNSHNATNISLGYSSPTEALLASSDEEMKVFSVVMPTEVN